ncbi:MAG TPA: MMPL family transporter [Caulobacteraceae bacterium]|nr:MMPL family transporter [Caulobacteraceae bacterium]
MSDGADRAASLLVRLVEACADHARTVVAAALVLGLAAGFFAASHFQLSSDTEGLISGKLAWRQREFAFDRMFQPEGDQIVVVVDAATPELAQQAAAGLSARLASRRDLFRFVSRPDGGPFFAREGLLFEPLGDVKSQMSKLVQAQPFLGPLAADPSLRGLAGSLQTAVQGVSAGQAPIGDLGRPMTALADALEAQRSGRPAFLSWRELIAGKSDPLHERRQIVLASPVLNFTRLLSGADASDFVRAAARSMSLDPAHGVRVRLTGPVPLQDEEFATLADRAVLIGSLACFAIVAMLWMAVRSIRLIGAIVLTTVLGLVCAAAAGLLVFRTYNVISVAFIPLFVGLGIDFGIQFSVRWRSEAASGLPVREALIATARGMGRSLTLAAAAIASGFLAFAPTDYVGVSQLGVIAGLGMIIALVLNLTLLPALIRLSPPKPALLRTQTSPLASIDAWVLGHRRVIVGGAIVLALICAALLPRLTFDFNTLHMKSAKVESVATLLDLMRDPEQTPNTMEVVSPSLAAADAMARRLSALPQVSQARTLSSFVPPDQPPKLAEIQDKAQLLDLTLDPIVTAPPPSDAETIAGLRAAAQQLRTGAQTSAAAGAPAARLAGEFEWLAAAPPKERSKADTLLMSPLKTLLELTRNALEAQPVTLADLPQDIRRDWISPDGHARVSATPKGDSNDNAVLERFIDAVRGVAPQATGVAYDVQMGGRTVSGAFAEAGVLSFLVITALLYAVLRRVRDVAITMAPIVLTGFLTLGSCVVIGQPLNFANIIALPLLFGIGVAFHIYFVMAWRSGGSHLLTSSLTRAIFFSALATATGFGSLWASRHPGTASMGKLLMISLIWTLVSALLFQPALMGPPREPRAV